MKRIMRDIVGALMVIIPIIGIMAPFVNDVTKELDKQNERKKEFVYVEFNCNEYGYNPYINKEDIQTVYVMKTVAYCSCEKCCGWNTGITYSGTKATQGRTVACNFNRFPIGTKILIDGHQYIVEDAGDLSENTIDVYFNSHEDALQYGVQWKVVEIAKN